MEKDKINLSKVELRLSYLSGINFFWVDLTTQIYLLSGFLIELNRTMLESK